MLTRIVNYPHYEDHPTGDNIRGVAAGIGVNKASSKGADNIGVVDQGWNHYKDKNQRKTCGNGDDKIFEKCFSHSVMGELVFASIE